mgnify:CR=1 FL=1
MAATKTPSQLITLFSNAAVVAQNTVSTEYERRWLRYFIFHLVGPRVTDSVRIQVSCDGTNWTTLEDMTGQSVIYRAGQGVFPYFRAIRLDAPVDANDKILLLAYCADDGQSFK